VRLTALQRPPAQQHGVVLIFSLIVLLILTIGAVALMRSMSSSLFSAGNMAIRRDLVNQGEWALANVSKQFQSGGALVGLTTTNVQARNYSATILTANPQGVPLALLNGTTFSNVGTAANDILGATPDVSIRYVIDRLCSSGTSTASSANCSQSVAGPTGGTFGKGVSPPPLPTATIYRLSVRVSGARGTQVFLQSTFCMSGS
jgi:Tfp pilus assembly protein PilX